MKLVTTTLLGFAGGTLLAASAFAADISLKDDAPVAFNWTGVYAGGQVGWGRMKQTNTATITHQTRTKKAVEDQLILDAYNAKDGLRERLQAAIPAAEICSR